MTTILETPAKTAFRRLHEAANGGDLEAIGRALDVLVAPDVVVHTPLRTEAVGPQVLKDVFATLLRAYPDLHVAVEDLIEEGDRIAGRNTVTGTHRGELMGIAPTGRRVVYDEVVVLRFAGGRVAEVWAVVDVLAQLRQLGAVAA